MTLNAAVAGDNGGILVGGTAYGPVDNHDISGDSDAMVAAIDADGNLSWAAVYGGSNRDSAYGLARTSDGDIVLVGSGYSTDGDFANRNSKSGRAFALEVAPDHTLTWVKSFGGSATDMLSTVTVSPTGDILAVGQTSSTDGNLKPTCGMEDALLVSIPQA